MHDKKQPFEEDIEWFENKCRRKGTDTTVSDKEEFAERTAIIFCNNICTEQAAREMAFNMMCEDD